MVAKDGNAFLCFLTEALIWLKDFGMFLVTAGRINIRRFDGDEWSVIYIGNNYAHSEEELRRCLFRSDPIVTHIGRVFVWDAGKLLPRLTEQADMVVCELNRCVSFRLPHLKYSFRYSPWVRMRLAIGRPIDEIISGATSRKSTINAMLKVGFTCDYTRKLSDLELFYHNMHVPLVSSRHGDVGLTVDLDAQKKTLRRGGGLLMLKLDNNYVGGVLGFGIGKTFFLKCVGLDERHFDLLDRDAIIALYWFTLEWANNNGFQYLDFGLSRPRLGDGVFWSKFLWGACIQRNFLEFGSKYWLFASRGMNASFRKLFNDAGFIVESGDKFRLVILKEDKSSELDHSDKEMAHLTKVSNRLGLDDFLILPQ